MSEIIYTASFESAFKQVILHEGGYVNDKRDRGGETNYGITKSVAEANGYSSDMKDLPISTAKAIYKKQYWDVLKLDEISVFSTKIAAELFDSAVNCGCGTVARWLQSALNLFVQINGIDLKVDGNIGSVTLNAFKALRKEDYSNFLKVLNLFQGNLYIKIALADETQRRFIRGWLNRVIL